MATSANDRIDEDVQRAVLFLDYDGTLHRGPTYRTRRGIVSSDPERIALFEFAPLLDALLKPYPQLEIVLSTSWVPVLGFKRAKKFLPTSLRERVVGATFHSMYADAFAWPTIGRGIQVLRYVGVHRLRRWLAIDDQDDGAEGYEKHFVKCNQALGLGDSETVELLQCRLAEQFGEV
ncbi:HAD domain-containing protein [Paraburkholderia sp. Cpub6]|uniref:HAD domain-containing protein n=1 Tax=Paraburkholderia sp. Cpub6 TaxID=2723094 RepID=UPI00161E32DA|nr:HAD domain-containing protein [Paraburkholderia sp. Cpub6]MBB5462343.1 hypothetical protein [Paraburkholderia sp. Cpub6]